MNIVYSSDDGYAELAGVSMLSLLENNKNNDIHIYILDNGISEENKNNLSTIAKSYSNCNITFIDMGYTKEEINTTLSLGRLSIATYARLFVSTALPKTVNKVLYLDCDTLVRGSIAHLCDETLENHILGGVLDCILKPQKKLIFHKSSDIYVNAGVLLIDVAKWRKLNVEKKFIDFISFFKGNVPHHDQGIINGVFKGNIKPLHPKYNYMMFFSRFNSSYLIRRTGIKGYYSQDTIDEANNNPVILHIVVGENRPWIKGNVHPYGDEWMRYRKMSPWSELPLRDKPVSPTILGRAKQRAIKSLPQPIVGSLRRIKLIKQYVYSLKCRKTSEIRFEDCCVHNER